MRATDVVRLRLADTAVTSESANPFGSAALATGAAVPVPVPVATDKAGLAANPADDAADDDDHEVAAAAAGLVAAPAGGGGAYGRI